MCVWACVCVSQIGLIFCWLSAEMPDNIDLVAEVSGRSVWLLSNQSDYTHKHASTHTYKKNSIRATDSVIDFPVYLCVGQCRLMAHVLYFNGCVSFHVSWNYCFFFLTEEENEVCFNPFCSCQFLHVTLVLEKKKRIGLCLLVFDRFYSTALTLFDMPVCSKKNLNSTLLRPPLIVHPGFLGLGLGLRAYSYGLQTHNY